jgi:hypothetical protein
VAVRQPLLDHQVLDEERFRIAGLPVAQPRQQRLVGGFGVEVIVSGPIDPRGMI